jgi:hypothetical protein
MIKMKKSLCYAVSIQWPGAEPPLESVVDMLRFDGASVISWGKHSKTETFWMNLQIDRTGINVLGHLETVRGRWASFGFKFHTDKWFVERQGDLELDNPPGYVEPRYDLMRG